MNQQYPGKVQAAALCRFRISSGDSHRSILTLTENRRNEPSNLGHSGPLCSYLPIMSIRLQVLLVSLGRFRRRVRSGLPPRDCHITGACNPPIRGV